MDLERGDIDIKKRCYMFTFFLCHFLKSLLFFFTLEEHHQKTKLDEKNIFEANCYLGEVKYRQGGFALLL